MTPSDENHPPRLRVAVIYGGRSTEYEISLQSAASVVANLDRKRFEIVPIHIDQRGAFHQQLLPEQTAGQSVALPVSASAPTLALAARAGQLFEPEGPAGLAAKSGARDASSLAAIGGAHGGSHIDVVFPVMHGPLCEDGSIQGLLELADVPYVGTRVLGSAMCMDKDVAKRLVRAEGIAAVVPYIALRAREWQQNCPAWMRRIEAELGYPVFVKPATLGSSVGVSRARDGAELSSAVALALEYDDKLLVEQAVNAREIEFAVLAAADEGAAPEVSVPGEIAPADAFYSFERKYLDAGAELFVPAELEPATVAKGQDAARRIFLALECEGLARVDFFLDRQSGELYFNEVNTLPGFTSISMYPKLWEASGLPYPRLLERLIDHAQRRHARRSKLRRER